MERDSVIRKFRITASDGKTYDALHYSLQMIIAVDLLQDVGKLTAEIAKLHAETEFEKVSCDSG